MRRFCGAGPRALRIGGNTTTAAQRVAWLDKCIAATYLASARIRWTAKPGGRRAVTQSGSHQIWFSMSSAAQDRQVISSLSITSPTVTRGGITMTPGVDVHAPLSYCFGGRAIRRAAARRYGKLGIERTGHAQFANQRIRGGP